MASTAGELAGKLSETTQKHEKELVIDFGVDRLLHFIGVYATLFLAIFTEIVTLTKGSLVHCYGENKTADSSFRDYAQTFCGKSFHFFSDNGTNFDVFDTKYTIAVARAVPIILLSQTACMFYPFIQWHINVGGRLSGHLAFVRVFLDDLYRKLKIIPSGYVRNGAAYDKCDEYMNASRLWKDDVGSAQTSPTNQPSNVRQRNQINANQQNEGDRLLPTHCPSPPKCDSTNWLYGDTKDKHLFSLFCYENFATLEHFSYIICYQRLAGGSGTEQSKTRPILQGILDIWSNENNLSSTYLVKKYVNRLWTGIGASVAWLIVVLGILIPYVIRSQNASYRCNVVTDEGEMPIQCTVKQLPGVMEALILDAVLMLVYVIVAVIQWCTVKECPKKASSRYFEELNKITNVALHAVKLIENENKKVKEQNLNVTLIKN